MKASGIPEGPSREPIKHHKDYLFKWKLIMREGPGSRGMERRKTWPFCPIHFHPETNSFPKNMPGSFPVRGPKGRHNSSPV
jgi:hypothetical protein